MWVRGSDWNISKCSSKAKDINACNRVGKQGRVIVKFLRRKDCQQVLSVKKDIQEITATDLDFPNTTTKLYLNEILCPDYRILWSKSKALLQWVKFLVISFQMVHLKYVYKKRGLQFRLHVQLTLKSIFLVWTWVLQGRLDLHFYSFFTVVFLMVWLYQCLIYFLFFKFWISALTGQTHNFCIMAL